MNGGASITLLFLVMTPFGCPALSIRSTTDKAFAQLPIVRQFFLFPNYSLVSDESLFENVRPRLCARFSSAFLLALHHHGKQYL